jgi:4'-phosphopantetheinyl transferase
MASVYIQWGRPSAKPFLNQADVHVWAADLDTSSSGLSAFQATLSQDELDRAKRFHFERDRRHFISGRGILRSIIDSYLKIGPALLQFAYGPCGKPLLANLPANRALHFNLAHSDGLLMVALSETCPVGIDVERVRPVDGIDGLVERFCPPRANLDWQTLPLHQRPIAFFNLWTRKEACLKATGVGLSAEIDELEVSFLPGEPVRVLKFAGMALSADKWTLKDLSPAENYVAAIAAATPEVKLSCWQWPG